MARRRRGYNTMAAEKIRICKRENRRENIRQRWNVYNEHEKTRIVFI